MEDGSEGASRRPQEVVRKGLEHFTGIFLEPQTQAGTYRATQTRRSTKPTADASIFSYENTTDQVFVATVTYPLAEHTK